MSESKVGESNPNAGPPPQTVGLMGIRGQGKDFPNGGVVYLRHASGLLVENFQFHGPTLLLVIQGPDRAQMLVMLGVKPSPSA